MIKMLPDYTDDDLRPYDQVYTAYDLAEDIVRIIETPTTAPSTIERILQHLRQCEFIK